MVSDASCSSLPCSSCVRTRTVLHPHCPLLHLYCPVLHLYCPLLHPYCPLLHPHCLLLHLHCRLHMYCPLLHLYCPLLHLYCPLLHLYFPLLHMYCCFAGITDDMLRQPGLPTIHEAWNDVLNLIARLTPPEAKPMLVAYNGFAFDFKMLCCCLLRQQQQCRNGAAAAAVASTTGSSSSKWWWLPDGLLALDGLQIARSLKLKELARLDNLKQGEQ